MDEDMNYDEDMKEEEEEMNNIEIIKFIRRQDNFNITIMKDIVALKSNDKNIISSLNYLKIQDDNNKKIRTDIENIKHNMNENNIDISQKIHKNLAIFIKKQENINTEIQNNIKKIIEDNNKSNIELKNNLENLKKIIKNELISESYYQYLCMGIFISIMVLC